MKLRHVVCGVAVVAAMMLSANWGWADEKDPDRGRDHKQGHEGHDHEHGQEGHDHEGGDKDAGEIPPEMAAWLKYAAPGEHHEHLQPLAGKWELAVQHRHSAEAPWDESKATSEIRPVLGGRFLVEKVTGEFMGGVFEGLGIYGYDNFHKKYTSIWMDTMSTMTMSSTGTCDGSGKVFTYVGDSEDPASGDTKQMRSVTRVVNDNKHVMEMYHTGPAGKEFKVMEIVYTRR
ncbi:MAG: DUF1579 domain-containing protein [Planctomycetota bacterium]